LEVGKRVLLLHSYPPTPCLYPFEKGLRLLGYDVVTAGPTASYGDSSQFERLEPECEYVEIGADAHLNDIFEKTGGVPDWVLYLQPNAGFLPEGLRDCPVPTVGWITEEYKFADVDQRLYYYFDMAPTSFPHISQLYRERGYDNRVCCNFIFCNWLVPDIEPETRDIDVGFVGTIHPEISRERCRELERLLLLRQEGVNVVARSGVFLVDMLNFYARSKIVFQHSGQGPNNLTFRISEAMAAGALVLAGRPEDVGDLVGQQLVEGEHIVYYDSWDEAVELIQRYTSNEEERARIAEAGRRLIVEEFPWYKQIEYFVDTCVRTIPEDFLARRHERLARFGVDERREREDYARYFILVAGKGAPAQRQLEQIEGWERDANLLCAHAVASALIRDGTQYAKDTQEALAQRPGHPLVRFNHAMFAFHTREGLDRTAAIRPIRRALQALDRVDPDTLDPAELNGIYVSPDMNRWRREVSYTHFDTMDARERTRRLVELHRYELQRALGVVNCDHGEWAAAIVPLSRALAIVPDDGYTMFYLARAFAEEGRPTQAVAVYREAISLEGMFFDARLRLMGLYGQHNQAEEGLAVALETIPIASPFPIEHAQWLFYAATLEARLARPAEARESLDASLGVLEDAGPISHQDSAQAIHEAIAALAKKLETA
jgi:tetratricopeptide (TPR) repeat protein